MTPDACAPKSLTCRTDFLKDEMFITSYQPLQLTRKNPGRVLPILAHHYHSIAHAKAPLSWNGLSGIGANTLGGDINRLTAAILLLAREQPLLSDAP